MQVCQVLTVSEKENIEYFSKISTFPIISLWEL